MTLKKSIIVLFGIQFALVIVLGVCSVLLFQDQNDLNKSQDVYLNSYLLADELRQSSDDLTRFARTYVATGDEKFEQQYWAVLDIRAGKSPRPEQYNRIYWDFVAATGLKPRPDGRAVSLYELMVREGFTEAEFAKLEEAERNSNELVKSERVAMNAVKGRFADAFGNFSVVGEPDRAMAIRIMNDEAYHKAKAGIMKPIDEFFGMFMDRTASHIIMHQRRAAQLLWSILILTGAILCMFWYSFVTIRRQIFNRERAEEARRISERRFRATLENVQLIAIELDPEGKVLFCNDYLLNLVKFRKDEVVGHDWFGQFLPEGERESVRAVHREILSGDARFLHFENHLQLRSGELRLIRWNNTLVRGAKECDTTIISLGEDITERHELEFKLAEQTEKFRGIFEESVAAIYVFDGERRFIDTNQAGLDLLGYSREELLTMSIPDVDADPVVVQPAHSQLLAGDRIINYEHRLVRKDGRVITVLNNSRPVTNSHGAVVGMQSTLIDITDRKRAEDELKQAQLLLRSSIESHKDTVLKSIDRDYRYLYFNEAHARVMKQAYNVDITLGNSILECISSESDRYDLKEKYDRVLNGESISSVRTYGKADQTYYETFYSPIRNDAGEIIGITALARDITARIHQEEERNLTASLIMLLNSRISAHDLMSNITSLLRDWSGCEAVGIRMRDGDDFPYFETRGFPARFVELENHLCAYDKDGKIHRDGNGNPVLECMCGNILCGRFDASKPFFSPHGSFWSNNTTKLLASTSDADRQARTRNRCNGEGYESVALIPLRTANEVFGLLQFNDHRPERFTAEGIALMERVADSIAIALAEHKAEAALKKSQLLLKSSLESQKDTVLLSIDRNYQYLYFNKAHFDVMKYAYGIDVTLGMNILECMTDDEDRRAAKDNFDRALNGESHSNVRQFGSLNIAYYESFFNPILNERNEIIGATALARDITARLRADEERLQFERQIQQTQKLESLGVLSGGIAHDFNNILMAVLGNAELALDEVSPTSPARESITQITTAAHRAAELCRQMMAYSGKASFVNESVDLCGLIEEMSHLLKTSISKKVIMNLNLTPDLPAVHGDPSQLRQIVMNLIINASDAIGDQSGVITVAASREFCDEEFLRDTELHDSLPSGSYVCLEVTDTGSGMDAETRTRIFEPFFTTKFTGRGLGLSAVLGIVKTHKGALKLVSEPNKGTTFKVYLPAAESNLSTVQARELSAPLHKARNGTVLLVDDEAMLLTLGRKMLERMGYDVLTATDGCEAVDLYRAQSGRINLVILDMTMPNMSGQEAFIELTRIDPDVRVIIASGHTAKDVSACFRDRSPAGYLQKPFTIGKLRELIEGVMPSRNSATVSSGT